MNEKCKMPTILEVSSDRIGASDSLLFLRPGVGGKDARES